MLFKLKVIRLDCGVFKILLNPLQFPSGSSDSIYLVVPEARVYGWMGCDGWMGWTEYQKCLLIIFTLRYIKDYTHIYLNMYIKAVRTNVF